MLSNVTVALALVLHLAQGPALSQTPTLVQTPAPPPKQTPASTEPPQTPTETAAPADPATTAFATDAGLLLVLIKPDKTDDYEAVLRALQEALAKDPDPVRHGVAEGWRVFKAAEPDGKGNTVYIHALWPAVPGFDYRPSLLLDELVSGVSLDLLDKYRDAFAAPPSKLSLSELAHMSVAPVAPITPPPDPAVPPPPKKPGGQ